MSTYETISRIRNPYVDLSTHIILYDYLLTYGIIMRNMNQMLTQGIILHKSLLNYVPYTPLCLRALRAFVPYVPSRLACLDFDAP